MGNLNGLVKTLLSFCFDLEPWTVALRLQRQLPFQPIQLCPVEPLSSSLHRTQRLDQHVEPLFCLSPFPIRLSQQSKPIRLSQSAPVARTSL